jgi:EPS-associated MarR family transcriptional regulator
LANEEAVLKILRLTDKVVTQKSIAQEIGYSVGKVNYILKALVDKGLIKVENFANSTQKKNYKYLLTKQGIEEKIKLTEKFIERKKREYEELQSELGLMREER